MRRATASRVAEGSVDKTGHQRTEAFVIFGLSRGGGGAKCAAVESPLERDDLVFLFGAMESCQLNRRFVRLGARVAEKGLSAKAASRQHFGPSALGIDVPGVRHVDQRSDLLLDRVDDLRRAMPQEVAAPAGEQIQIPGAFAIPDIGPLAAYQVNWIADVVGDHVFLKLSDRIRGTHVLRTGQRNAPRVGKW